VVPTAHYLMGGVICNVDTSTEIEGLYVAGEDAGGMHGANRLGGNGVANSTVFGGIAGETMAAAIAAGLGTRGADDDHIAAERERAEMPFARKPVNLHPLREKLLDRMWDDVGISREALGLQRGASALGDMMLELLDAGVADSNRAFNLTWHDWLNLRSLIETSEVITAAALKRENSRGAHFREDFPAPGDLATSRFTVARQRDGTLTLTDEPVIFSIVKPGDTILKDPIAAE
jgi:fumarate reductase flavoprotein subunit